MPLTQVELEEIQAEAMADDVPINPKMYEWTREQAVAYFDSGGTQSPAVAGAASGVFALPPCKLITGADLPMSSLAGHPVFIMNVASR